jgi:hypothetical protein
MLNIFKKESVLTYNNFNVWVLTVGTLILISPIFALINGISTSITFLFFAISLYFNFDRKERFLKYYIILFCYYIFICIVLSIFHQEVSFIPLPFFFLTSVYFVLISSNNDIVKFVDFASNIIFLITFGALVGFFYAFFFGQPSFIFKNPNGLENQVFLTTMTNSRWGNFIRPSGIYDEPGALSFFICGICFLRHLLNFEKKRTRLILFLGLITFSVAHVIYMAFHLISDSNFKFKINLIKKSFYFILISISIYFILSYTGTWEWISLIFFGRFQSESSGLFPGDNRSMFFFNALEYISKHPLNILFGESMKTNFENVSFDYGVVGSNPLMPILSFGIFISLPYYIILLLLFISIIKGRKYFVSIGFALVLFQREFFLVVSYSMIFVLVFRILYINLINEKKGINSIWHKT